MLRALAHCHLKGVVLCDVKPDNFLFDRKGHDAVLKAIDLGLSRRFTPGQALRRAAGTVRHTPPSLPPPPPVACESGLRVEQSRETPTDRPLPRLSLRSLHHESTTPRSILAPTSQPHTAHMSTV
jgi:serine/threonine protein kinase